MADDEAKDDAAPAEGQSSGTRRRSRWPWVLFGVVVVLPAAIYGLWVFVALNTTYSEGKRAGFMQKFSRKGWVCKTWEGELAIVTLPGVAQERFAFSVRNDSVANEINRLIGSRVSISYRQHPDVPGTCFGETNYFVTGVEAIK